MRRLLIRPGGIGDCILTFPAMEYLAAGYTEVWISSSVVPLIGFADIVKPLSATGLDLVGVGDLSIPGLLASHLLSFDSVVSWYGENRPEFRQALNAIGVRCEFLRALPPSWYVGHAADFFASQVGAPMGLLPHIQVQKTQVQKTEPRERVVIHPFSGGLRKNWPLPFFRELSLQLALPVDWTAGPEEPLAEAVYFDRLDSLANWLSGARLYIGNDSGITHLAAAAGIPVLALFGPTSPETWVPRGSHVTVLRRDPIERLTVEEVKTVANRLILERG